MSQTSSRPNRPATLFPSCALAFFLLFGAGNGVSADDSTRLSAALRERDQGRTHAALSMLEQLRQTSPESGRLILEIAVVHIQLRQYDSAERLLADLLDRSDLPPKVRVNTQLLLLKTRRLRQRQDDDAFALVAETGAAYQQSPHAGHALVDAHLGIRHSLGLATLNLSGYPVFTHWVNEADINTFYLPDTGITEAYADVSTGVQLENPPHRLIPALTYSLAENGSGPGWALKGQWKPVPLLLLTGQVSHHWLSNGATKRFSSARIQLFNGRPVRWALGYRGLNTAEADSRHLLTDVSYRHRDRLYLTLGAEYRLSGLESSPESSVYLQGNLPLYNGFTLLTELRYLDYPAGDIGGYGRLGVSWRK